MYALLLRIRLFPSDKGGYESNKGCTPYDTSNPIMTVHRQIGCNAKPSKSNDQSEKQTSYALYEHHGVYAPNLSSPFCRLDLCLLENPINPCWINLF